MEHTKEKKLTVATKKSAKPETLQGQYIETVGRRKESIARVRITHGKQEGFIVNDKPAEKYFAHPSLQKIVTAPVSRLKPEMPIFISAKVFGGGTRGQAEAVRHGISRALAKLDPIFKDRLKKMNFLTRDPRAKERRKYGLKKARRAPQWAKR